jgi:hypothetical protein
MSSSSQSSASRASGTTRRVRTTPRIDLLAEVHRAFHVREEHGDPLALAFEGGLRLQDFIGEVFRGVGAGIALRR